MGRLQTVIAIIFKTRLRPCRIAVCADSENYSLADYFQVNMNKFRKQFRLSITLNSQRALRKPKTENLKPQTATAWRNAFPNRELGPLQPPGFLNKGLELRLHWLAQPRARYAPPPSAKPRSHSKRREVKALLVMLRLSTQCHCRCLACRFYTEGKNRLIEIQATACSCCTVGNILDRLGSAQDTTHYHKWRTTHPVQR